MRGSTRLAAIPIALLFLTGSTRAELMPLFNAGVDETRAPLPVDAADPHWTVVAARTSRRPIRPSSRAPSSTSDKCTNHQMQRTDSA